MANSTTSTKLLPGLSNHSVPAHRDAEDRRRGSSQCRNRVEHVFPGEHQRNRRRYVGEDTSERAVLRRRNSRLKNIATAARARRCPPPPVWYTRPSSTRVPEAGIGENTHVVAHPNKRDSMLGLSGRRKKLISIFDTTATPPDRPAVISWAREATAQGHIGTT